MTPPAGSWTLAGLVFQAYSKTLQRMGIRGQVRERVSEEARAVMDKPPLVITQVDGTLLEEMMVAVAGLRGRDAVREVAAAAMAESLGGVLNTLLATTLRLFGPSPASVFERLGSVAAAMIRGVDFSYQAFNETSGVIRIGFPAPVAEAYQAAWEGTLEYVFALCKMPGTVRSRTAGAARTIELDAQWTARERSG